MSATRYDCTDCPEYNMTEREAADHAHTYRHCVPESSPAADCTSGFCRRWDH